MTQHPVVSIITVCFNVEDELRLTMNSVLEQGYNRIEHIVIDGGSSDGSLNAIETYSKSIYSLGGELKWVSESDTGIYDAMNKGLALATGDWVIFMNAGDSFASKSVLTDVFSVNRTSNIIFGKSITRYKHLTAIRYLDFETHNENWYLSKMPNHQAIFINKSLYTKHTYDLSYKYSSDTVYLRKIFGLAISIDEIEFSICNFELGGKSNYYNDYSTFKALVFDSCRLHDKVVVPTTKHAIKYIFQVILGKDLYLKYYIKRLNKR